MAEESNIVDFIALAQAGVPLRTRDRRAVTVIAIDAALGIMRGSVVLEGELTWRRDGTYSDAPLGVAGPFDLAPPAPSQIETRRASLRDALNDEDAKSRAPFCCD